MCFGSKYSGAAMAIGCLEKQVCKRYQQLVKWTYGCGGEHKELDAQYQRGFEEGKAAAAQENREKAD